METEPNRTQRNETALRWFLVLMLEPEQRRQVLERELEFGLAAAEQRREFAAQLDAEGKTGALLDLSHRLDAVMAEA